MEELIANDSKYKSLYASGAKAWKQLQLSTTLVWGSTPLSFTNMG